MRRGTLLALWLLVLSPVSASAGSPGECARLMRQIHHYQDMADRAQKADSAMWEDRMQGQVDLLNEQLLQRCPDWAKDQLAVREAARQFAEFLKLAGKAALTFFTMGAF